jgi:hypothetical protein
LLKNCILFLVAKSKKGYNYKSGQGQRKAAPETERQLPEVSGKNDF